MCAGDCLVFDGTDLVDTCACCVQARAKPDLADADFAGGDTILYSGVLAAGGRGLGLSDNLLVSDRLLSGKFHLTALAIRAEFFRKVKKCLMQKQ